MELRRVGVHLGVFVRRIAEDIESLIVQPD
jgi:hypothetical protein